jgi:hypothetical protein
MGVAAVGGAVGWLEGLGALALPQHHRFGATLVLVNGESCSIADPLHTELRKCVQD